MIKALDKNRIGSKTILNARIALNELKANTQALSLHWIKAHKGHEGNELADSYAKQGTALERNIYQACITKRSIMRKIDKKCNTFWEKKWTEYRHCRQTKNFYPEPSINLYRMTAQLSRSSLSLLIKIVIGQNNLNYLANIIFPNHTELCRFCEEEDETFIHLLNECPVFYSHRLDLLNGSPVVDSADWKPRTLVRFAQHPEIERALQAHSNE